MVVGEIRTRLKKFRPGRLRPTIATAYLTYMVVAERLERMHVDAAQRLLERARHS